MSPANRAASHSSASNATGKQRARRLAAVATALALCIALLPTRAAAWGANGHIDINQNAAEKIPDSMPAFMRTKSAIARIAYLGPEPDRWRGFAEYQLNESQAPDHFMDLDRLPALGITKLSDLPPGRYDFIKLAFEKRAAMKTSGDASVQANADTYLPDRIGFQPYITMEVFDRLKNAFRDYRAAKKAGQPTDAIEQDIIFYAGWLGHYVGDGSMPLHTSSYYDGWYGPNPNGYTTQKGIHARFETDFVDHNITAASFADMIHAPEAQPSDAPPLPAGAPPPPYVPGQPPRINEPFHAYLNYLADSNKLVERVYQFDKDHAFDGAGSPESIAFVKQRLAAGAQELLNLWYTAWLDSAE
jgi:hypothetical protein